MITKADMQQAPRLLKALDEETLRNRQTLVPWVTQTEIQAALLTVYLYQRQRDAEALSYHLGPSYNYKD